MTHTKPMPDNAGDFADWEDAKRACPKCNGPMKCRMWESHCGGYEDYLYRCTKCPHSYWIDGPDS